MKKNENKELSLRGAAGDVAISCDKVLSFLARCDASKKQRLSSLVRRKSERQKAQSFLRLRGASGAQGIFAPARVLFKHSSCRFLFILIRRSLEFFAFAQVAPAKNRDDSLLFSASPRTRFSEIATSAFRLLAMTIPTLALAMVLAIANVSESRADIVGCNDGDNNCESCGSGCNWSYDTETKSLSLSGNGATYTSIKVDSGDGRNLPWANYMNEIETIRVAPGSSLEIGDGAFFEATSLISVDMPNVKKIGDFAFDGATSLTSVDMPNVTTIGWGAFNGATSLTSVDMPNVTTIGSYAFSGAAKLSYAGFNLPVDVQSDAFWDTMIYSCSPKNLSACGSCGEQFIKRGRGCVSDCGDWYAPQDGVCAPDYETDENGNILLDDDSPEITEDIFGLSTTLGDATKIICRGDIEKCKDLLKNYPKYYDITDGYGNKAGGYYAPTDMSNLVKPATEANCESSRYYWSGTSCNNKKNGINCEENFKQIETWCNRVRYTPAEAAQVLRDTDNEIIMTFKVNR